MALLEPVDSEEIDVQMPEEIAKCEWLPKVSDLWKKHDFYDLEFY